MSSILPNRDPETGIRYGVIPFNDLYNCGEQFFDGADDLTFIDYQQEAKDSIRRGLESALENYPVKPERIKDVALEIFESLEDDINGGYEPDCPREKYEDGEYEILKLDETDLFVAKSPFFTFARECSPCAPGACYLRDSISEEDGAKAKYSPEQFEEFANHNGRPHLKCYCLGHEWFDEDNPAPYAVYSVATGELVEP